MRKKMVQFPTHDVSLYEACHIVKYSLDDDSIAPQSKVLAIQKIAELETHNSITNDELVNALRWIFKNYDFEVT